MARILETTGPKPRRVETTLTDAEALKAIEGRTDRFARDLVEAAHRGLLTHNRIVWLHILAMEGQPKPKVMPSNSTPKPQPKAKTPSTQLDAAGLSAVIALFDQAKQQLKKPKIRLQTSEGLEVTIAPASPRSSNVGFLYVTDGRGHYHGKISPMGAWYQTGKNASLTDLLHEFAADPAKTAQSYGRLTGRCCFCDKALSDERSTAVGYGGTCAKNWGLPWGDAKTDLSQELGGEPTPKRKSPKRAKPIENCPDINELFRSFDERLSNIFANL